MPAVILQHIGQRFSTYQQEHNRVDGVSLPQINP